MDDSSQREEKALRVEGRGCVFGGQEVFGYLPETETQVQFSVSTKSGELQHEAGLRTLPNGNVVMSYSKTTTEAGSALRVFFWELGNPLPPNNIRIAVFSLTLLAREARSGLLPRKLRWLDDQIAEAIFANELGIQMDQP